MATYSAVTLTILGDFISSPLHPSGHGVASNHVPDPRSSVAAVKAPSDSLPTATVVDLPFAALPFSSHGSTVLDVMGGDWFERVHIDPRSIAYGNILTDVDTSVTIYNAYRSASRELTSVNNPVPSGLILSGLPALPLTIPAQDGTSFILRATTSGVAAFDSSISFVTDVLTISLSVSGQRVVLFPYRPDSPFREELIWRTDVIEKRDQSEQRISLREYPVQRFPMSLFREDARETAIIRNTLVEWQGRNFAIPVWYESTRLTAAASAGALTVTVESTDNADYRVGGLVAIIQDEVNFEVLTLASKTSTTITFTAVLQKSWAVGVSVLPIRLCRIASRVAGSRPPVNAQRLTPVFRCVENVNSIASTAGFSSLNSKVLFDDGNLIRGAQSIDSSMQVIELGSVSGKASIQPVAPIGTQGLSKGFKTNSRTALWQLRQLLYALRGRQVAFYLPTFVKDFEATADLANGAVTLPIVNVGYSRFVQQRIPYERIVLIKTDGTFVHNTISDSVEVDLDNETLTVGTAWPSDITLAEIDRISYVQLARFDSDAITIEHIDAVGQASCIVPVKTTLSS